MSNNYILLYSVKVLIPSCYFVILLKQILPIFIILNQLFILDVSQIHILYFQTYFVFKYIFQTIMFTSIDKRGQLQ